MVKKETQGAEKIRAITEKLLKKMGFSGEIDVLENEITGKSSLWVNLKLEDPRILIGQHGTTILAFQHILRTIARRELENKVSFLVDVNEYRQKRIESLADLAHKTAEKVRKTKKLVVMQPMTSYERRLVHLALAKEDFITSGSLGEEPNRRIVVRPIEKPDKETEREIRKTVEE